MVPRKGYVDLHVMQPVLRARKREMAGEPARDGDANFYLGIAKCDSSMRLVSMTAW